MSIIDFKTRKVTHSENKKIDRNEEITLEEFLHHLSDAKKFKSYSLDELKTIDTDTLDPVVRRLMIRSVNN